MDFEVRINGRRASEFKCSGNNCGNTADMCIFNNDVTVWLCCDCAYGKDRPKIEFVYRPPQDKGTIND